MKNTLRTELRKALTNKMLYIAIGIGLVFCALDVLENCEKISLFNERLQQAITSGSRRRTGHDGYSLFYLWMGINPNTRGANLFFAIWPALGALAYGWSYIEERRSGVYNQIASRTSAKTYYICKYITVFVSGGLAVAIPVLLNLLANALVCPYAKISPVYNMVGNGYFMSELFHTSPWAYGLIWCVVVFLCGGVAACLCFVVGTKLRYGVMVVLTPYALYVAIDALIASLLPTVLVDYPYILSPLHLVKGMPGLCNPEWMVFLILGGLTLISFGVGYWQVVKHELA